MNAQTNQVAKSSVSVGLLNLEAFELSQRVANMLSHSTLVPEQYRAVTKVKAGKDGNGNWQYREEPNPSGLSNCIIALNIANRLGADELMVMQNLYIIEGRPAWSSQFIMAAINSCGRFTSLRFEIKELGEKEVEYQETQWSNGRKSNVTKKIKIQDTSCYAWVEEKGSLDENGKPVILKSSTISVEMAVKEGWYQKNGSKWQTMPEQMLRYRAASFFGRVYAPELLMGLRSAEEEQDAIVDVTPEQTQKSNAGQLRALKQKILAAKTVNDLDALEGEVAELSETDFPEINKIFNAQKDKLHGEIVDVEAKEVIEKKESQLKKTDEAPLEPDPVVVEQEEVQAPDTSKSLDVRKKYLLKLNKAQSHSELVEISREIEQEKGLTDTHRKYLAEVEQQRIAEFTTEVPAEEDMFAGVQDPSIVDAELSFVDLVVLRIQNAKSQDEINAEYANPAIDELSDEDRQRIDAAASQRESQLFG